MAAQKWEYKTMTLPERRTLMTRIFRWLTVALLAALLGQSVPVEAWAGAQTSRTVAELELMTEEELAGQADSSCTTYLIYHGHDFQKSSDAITYFQTVSLVVRKKKGGRGATAVKMCPRL